MQSIITDATSEVSSGYKPIVNSFGQPIDDQIKERLKSDPVKKTNQPSQKAKNRYNNAVNDAQKRLSLDEEQAKGFVNNIVGNEGYMNKQHIKEVDTNIQEALHKRKERIVPEEKPAPDLEDRLKKFKESNRQERLEKFKNKFNTQNDQVELFYNGGAKYDPNNTQNVSAISQTEIDSTINDYERKKGNVPDPKYKDMDQLSLDGMLPSDKPITPEPVMDDQIKMRIDDTGKLTHYGDFSKDQHDVVALKRRIDKGENLSKEEWKKISDHENNPEWNKRWEGRSQAREHRKQVLAEGQTNSPAYKELQKEVDAARNWEMPERAIDNNTDTFEQRLSKIKNKTKESRLKSDQEFFKNRKYVPPKQSKIYDKAAQEAADKAVQESAATASREVVEEGIGKTVKNNADDVAKKLTKTKVGRIAAAVGVGALVVSNMNKNKGQQPNGQLYGQQTPYGY